MIGVSVRKQHAVNDADLLTQQLGSQIWRSIGQEVPLFQSNHGRASQPLIAGMIAGANTARAAHRWDTHGRTRT
jgi:hypothetical protein